MQRGRKRKLNIEVQQKIEDSIKKIEAILTSQTDFQFLLGDETVRRLLQKLKQRRDASSVSMIKDVIEDRIRQRNADEASRRTATCVPNAKEGYFGTVYSADSKSGSYVVLSSTYDKYRRPPRKEPIAQSHKWNPPSISSPKLTLQWKPEVGQFCRELLKLGDREPSLPISNPPGCKGWLQARNSALILPAHTVTHNVSANPQNFLRFVNTITNEPPPKFRYIAQHVWHSSYERPVIPKGYMEHCECKDSRDSFKGGVSVLCENCECSDRGFSSDANGFYDTRNAGRLLTTTSIWRDSYPTLIVECNMNCKCDPQLCTNRVVQKQTHTPRMVVERMEEKGWGVVTLETIEKGTFVCEYVGEIISEIIAESRGREYDAQGLSYLWTQKTDHAPTIDATTMGNISRFVNHSCDPNLFACEILVESRQMAHIPRIAFFALDRIHIGEELTIDYAYDLSDHPKQIIRCACGSSNCRGRIR